MSEVDNAEFWIKYFMSLSDNEVGKEMNAFFPNDMSKERLELLEKMNENKEFTTWLLQDYKQDDK
jgi:hypothetical protein